MKLPLCFGVRSGFEQKLIEPSLQALWTNVSLQEACCVCKQPISSWSIVLLQWTQKHLVWWEHTVYVIEVRNVPEEHTRKHFSQVLTTAVCKVRVSLFVHQNVRKQLYFKEWRNCNVLQQKYNLAFAVYLLITHSLSHTHTHTRRHICSHFQTCPSPAPSKASTSQFLMNIRKCQWVMGIVPCCSVQQHVCICVAIGRKSLPASSSQVSQVVAMPT